MLGGTGQGATAAVHRPSWKWWHPAYSGIWPTLLFPISPQSGVTGSQSGGKSQGLSCLWSSWERGSRAKQGINAGFRLSAAGLGSGSMSPLHTSCHRVLSQGQRPPLQSVLQCTLFLQCPTDAESQIIHWQYAHEQTLIFQKRYNTVQKLINIFDKVRRGVKSVGWGLVS